MGPDRSQGLEVGGIKVQDGRNNKRTCHACVDRDAVGQGSGWAGQVEVKTRRTDSGRWFLSRVCCQDIGLRLRFSLQLGEN